MGWRKAKSRPGDKIFDVAQETAPGVVDCLLRLLGVVHRSSDPLLFRVFPYPRKLVGETLGSQPLQHVRCTVSPAGMLNRKCWAVTYFPGKRFPSCMADGHWPS